MQSLYYTSHFLKFVYVLCKMKLCNLSHIIMTGALTSVLQESQGLTVTAFVILLHADFQVDDYHTWLLI